MSVLEYQYCRCFKHGFYIIRFCTASLQTLEETFRKCMCKTTITNRHGFSYFYWNIIRNSNSFFFFCLYSAGPCPCESAGTKAEFSLSGAVNLNQWSAAVSCHSGNSVSLSICSPPDARIGRYSLTMTQGGSTRLGDFILLFNPWCPGNILF